MKTFKKLFAYSAIFALLATMMPTYANAASYDAELTEAYGYAKNKWITTMTSIDNADMYGNLTRVAMAKMVANYVLDLGLQELDTTKECNFPDVSASLDEAYDNGVTKACQLGLMGVGIEKFNPNGIVTRAEFGTVLSRALWGDEYNGADPYYKDHLQALKDEGIMTKIENPMATEVRGYVMLMMMRADDNYSPATGCSAEELLACIFVDDYESCIAACADEVKEPVKPGSATISKVSAPATQEVPMNAQGIKVGTIKITGGTNGARVSTVVVKQTGGLGEMGGIAGAYLANANNATDTRPFSSSTNEARVRFSTPLDLAAGKSETFDVFVSLKPNWWGATPNSTYNFAVSDAIVTNGTVSGTPIALGTVKTTSATVGEVTPSLTAAGSLTSGKTKQSIAKIDLSMNKNATVKKVVVNADVTTSNNDDLFDVYANVSAYYNGNKVGNVGIAKDKFIISDLNIQAPKGQIVKLELKGDVVFVGSSATVKVNVDVNNGTIVNDDASGYWMEVKAGTQRTTNITGIDLQVKKDMDGNKTVAPGEGNVLLYKGTIKSAVEIDITEFVLTATNVGTYTGFVSDEVILTVAGDVYDLNTVNSSLNPNIVSNTFTGNDEFTIAAGQTVDVEVRGSFLNGALDENFRFNFAVTKVKSVDNNTSFSVNNKDADGDRITVEKGSVTVKNATEAAPSGKVIASNKSNQEIGRFALRTKAEDGTLNEVTFAWKESGANNPTNVISNDSVRLVNLSGDEISATANVSTTGIVFSDISTNLPKDTDVNFRVVANTTTIGTGFFGEAFNLQIATGADVKVERNSGGDADVKLSSALNLKTYELGIEKPLVTVARKAGSDKIFTVTITNQDADEDIVVNAMKARVMLPYGNSDIVGDYCLNEQGSSNASCATPDAATGTGTIPWVAANFTAINATVSSNSSKSFEIYVDSSYYDLPSLAAEVTSLTYTYQGVTQTEAYNATTAE